MQTLIQTPSSSPTSSTTMGGRVTPLLESGRYTPVTSTPVKERGAHESVAGSLERKVQTVPRRRISADSRTFDKEKKSQRLSTPLRTTGSLGRKVSQVTAVHGGQQVYIPPSVPPKMANWMPDQQVSMCVICSEKFSMVRHICEFYLPTCHKVAKRSSFKYGREKVLDWSVWSKLTMTNNSHCLVFATNDVTTQLCNRWSNRNLHHRVTIDLTVKKASYQVNQETCTIDW